MPAPPLPSRTPRAPTAVAALVAAAACWGVGTVVSKQVVDDVAPLTLLPLQLAASCVFLLVIALVRREPFDLDAAGTPARRARRPQPRHRLRARPDRADHHHRQHVGAAVGPRTGRHHAARRARAPRAHPAGARGLRSRVAIAGVLLVVYQPGATGDAVGITLTVVSIGFCALYSVLTRRLLLDDSSLTVVLAQQAAALVFAVVLATVVAPAGGPGWDLGGHEPGVAGPPRGLGRPVLRRWVLVLRHRAAPGACVGARVVPAADPGLRARGRLPRRGAAGAEAVDRCGRHRGRDRRDRAATNVNGMRGNEPLTCSHRSGARSRWGE